MIRLFLFSLLFGSSLAFSDQPIRAQERADFFNPADEVMVPVSGARVAWANYSYLRRDFPQLKNFIDAQVNDWLIQNYAYISEAQTTLDGIVQSPIPIDPKREKKVGVRPENSGRAVVLSAGNTVSDVPQMLIDGKGMGLSAKNAELVKRAGRYRENNNGLHSLDKSIREVARQQAVQRLVDIHNASKGTGYETIESYFVIALPFKIRFDGGIEETASIYGRGATPTRFVGSELWTESFFDRHSTQHDGLGGIIDFGVTFIQDPIFERFLGMRGKDIDFEFPKIERTVETKESARVAQEFLCGDDKAVVDYVNRILEPSEEKWQEATTELRKRPAQTLLERVVPIFVRQLKKGYDYAQGEGSNCLQKDSAFTHFLQFLSKQGTREEWIGAFEAYDKKEPIFVHDERGGHIRSSNYGEILNYVLRQHYAIARPAKNLGMFQRCLDFFIFLTGKK